MAVYIEEFLWRGRPEGSKQPVAYHVVLGEVSEDAFGRQRITLSDAMTSAQAEAMGFPLATIVDTINASAVQERDEAVVARAEAEQAKATAEVERDEAVAARAEAEQIKVAAEAERDEAVAARAEAEQIKVAAEAERDEAVAARAEAEQAKATAEVERDEAVASLATEGQDA